MKAHLSHASLMYSLCLLVAFQFLKSTEEKKRERNSKLGLSGFKTHVLLLGQ